MTGRNDRNVSSYIDDEDDDDSLSILDSIDDDDDDPFGGRAPSVARNSAEQAAQATKPVKKPDEGFGRIQYYRALQGFLQALTEAAPLYIGERSRNPGISEKELQKKVGGLCKAHLSLVDRCLEVNEADSNDIMLRYQRRSLAKNIASLYRNSSIEEIDGLVDVSKQWSSQAEDFDNAGADHLSSDNILNVKLALFVGGLKSQTNLKGLWCSLTPSEVIGNLQNIAMSLSKEVAYNWSKRSQISDRESLFITSLSYSMDISEVAYKDLVLQSLSELEYLHSDEYLQLKVFEASVAEMDMGYVGEHSALLMDRMRKVAFGFIGNLTMPALSVSEEAKWKSCYISSIDNLFAEAWAESVSQFMEKIASMDKSERENYAKNNERMNLDHFMSIIKGKILNLEEPLATHEIDFELVRDRARRHLAWVWGVSDSLITARNDGVPEGFS